MAGEQVDDHAAQKIQVASEPSCLPVRQHEVVQQFGRGVAMIARYLEAIVRRVVADGGCTAQICNLGTDSRKNQDVRGLDILMSDALRMQLSQAGGGLMQDPQPPSQINLVSGEEMLTYVAVCQFEDQIKNQVVGR